MKAVFLALLITLPFQKAILTEEVQAPKVSKVKKSRGKGKGEAKSFAKHF